MERTVEFLKKIEDVLELCRQKGNVVDKKSVQQFLEGEALTEEQMNVVFDYLLSQKVHVRDYIKEVEAEAGNDSQMPDLSEEELRYLLHYEEEVRNLPEEDLLGKLLPEVVRMAIMLHHPEIFLGDLIQEGNMGLLLGMNENIQEEEVLLQMARQNMQTMVEVQTEIKRQDRRMADKVNELDAMISKFVEEMGRKVSVDELAELLEVTEDEIVDLIHLAGEEIEDDGNKELEENLISVVPDGIK